MSNALPTPSLPAPKSRGWLIFFSILSILVGVFAMAWPQLFTVVIEQFIGIVLVVSGVFALGAVAFGEEKGHRIATSVLAVVRIAAGLALLVYVKPGVQVITAILGGFFLAEGLTFLVSGFALRHNRAWPLILLNGLVALVLGGMILAQLAASSATVLGLLYGINSLFYGVSLFGFAMALPRGR